MIGWRVFWWADTVAALLVLLSGNFLLGERRTKAGDYSSESFFGQFISSVTLFHYFILSSLYQSVWTNKKTRGQALRCKATQSLPFGYCAKRIHELISPCWDAFWIYRHVRPHPQISVCRWKTDGIWSKFPTRIFSLVEPVAITSPHAHVIVVWLYLGWIPSFIPVTSFRKPMQ